MLVWCVARVPFRGQVALRLVFLETIPDGFLSAFCFRSLRRLVSRVLSITQPLQPSQQITGRNHNSGLKTDLDCPVADVGRDCGPLEEPRIKDQEED